MNEGASTFRDATKYLDMPRNEQALEVSALDYQKSWRKGNGTLLGVELNCQKLAGLWGFSNSLCF